MIHWTTDYLHGCKQFVDVGGTFSETWELDVGVGQGKPLSADLFNLASLSNALWTTISENVLYADDGGDVITGDSEAELNNNIRSTALLRSSWFKLAGLTLNAAKSELIGFGTTPEPLVIEGSTIFPSSSIKFLGLTIQSNLKFDEHVNDISGKMRSCAGRIRADARHLSVNDRRTLFNGWIRSIVGSNALAYIPHLCSNQLQKLNAAYNAGIRSIFNLPKKGYVPITTLRARLKIPSIGEIKDYILFFEAWKRRSEYLGPVQGAVTRGRANLNVPLPNKKGIAGKLLSTILCDYWNRLSRDIKTESKINKAKALIKRLSFDF